MNKFLIHSLIFMFLPSVLFAGDVNLKLLKEIDSIADKYKGEYRQVDKSDVQLIQKELQGIRDPDDLFFLIVYCFHKQENSKFMGVMLFMEIPLGIALSRLSENLGDSARNALISLRSRYGWKDVKLESLFNRYLKEQEATRRNSP